MRPDTSPEDHLAGKTSEIQHTSIAGKTVQKQRGNRFAIWLEQRVAELGLRVQSQTVADSTCLIRKLNEKSIGADDHA